MFRLGWGKKLQMKKVKGGGEKREEKKNEEGKKRSIYPVSFLHGVNMCLLVIKIFFINLEEFI